MCTKVIITNTTLTFGYTNNRSALIDIGMCTHTHTLLTIFVNKNVPVYEIRRNIITKK